MEFYKDIENSQQKLKVSVRYSLGGYNFTTSQQTVRGYYLHVQPVTIENGWEKFSAYTGIRKLLVPVTRQSNKRYEEACDLVTDALVEELKQHCKIEYSNIG